ncbi:hypothetical protein [Nocardia brasiliensis]|uniref:hypothetical protein n=2 Tax=Nocardia brasiliensis TaxID=37326 RepID=UPI0018945905|nr:hypothetical protein [Nocardia brasiliensis]MBF6125895.1 hypothetical protein [Nocardia brasiliensis]MBF6543097.1 hypothetical protein [Nocardia brasiliensis]
MAYHPAPSPSWIVEVAEALQDYLRQASALPAAAVSRPDATTGWYAQPPSTPVTGRTPWIHMTEISVVCAGESVVLTFGWELDQDPAQRYVLPMTTLEADATTGSDALITRLDLFLDTSNWRQHTHDIGNHTAVVVMPSRT